MNICKVQTVKISSLLKEKYIELNLKEKNKSKLIAELVNFIAKVALASEKEKKLFLKAIIEREKLGSTAIGGGIALPHAKIDSVRKIILAFGRSQEGVDFSSLDGEKTYIFFMVISPKQDIGGHLKILAKISRLLKDRSTVEILNKAKDKKSILGIIAKVEQSID